MLKLILRILKDEQGIAPLVLGGALAGGGALLGGLLGKNKQKTIDPYAQLRGQYQDYLGGKLGTSTPYQYNPQFELPQPAIEKQTEDIISGKLGNLPKIQSDIYGISGRYYDAQKAQMKDRFDYEAKQQKDMYNRLGLASSSPYLAASDQLTRKQGLEYNALEADIARQGIDQEMKALGLGEDIANQYLNQGQQLGQLQRGYSQIANQMSMADIERKIAEEQGWANMAGGLLGNNPPETYFQPNFWSQFGGGMQDVGTTLILDNMLGGTVGNGGGGQVPGTLFSRIYDRNKMFGGSPVNFG